MTARGSRPPLPRNVWVLGFVSLFMDLSSEIYHALLPAFITIVLGLPATALGAIDGVAEATANFAKLFLRPAVGPQPAGASRGSWAATGSPRCRSRLFPLASSAPLVMLARFADRIGKGIRGSPRDAMIADETPPEIRGRAFGLRQALDTAGALLAPLAAIGLMALAGEQYPRRLLDRDHPGRDLVPARLAGAARARAASRAAQEVALLRRLPPARQGHQAPAQVGFLFTLARFSEAFLILKGIDIGLSEAMSPLTLAIFNLAYVALAYPAGALSDRMSPRSILMAGIAVLIAGNLVLAETDELRRARRSARRCGARTWR